MNILLSQSEQLSFISDKKITEYASKLFNKLLTAANKDKNGIYKNVIDPFSASFDAIRQGITLEKWLEQEKSRQIQKTLQNYVGEFHQNVIGSIAGWENLLVGGSIDLRSRRMKIIAEIKNKHNTMNSSSALAIYDKLQRHLDYDESYKGFTAYCIVIIPHNPKPLNNTFHPSERGTARPLREDIRIIDGESFYTLATGESDALQKMYVRLVILLSKIKHIDPEKFVSGGIFEDLFNRAYIKK